MGDENYLTPEKYKAWFTLAGDSQLLVAHVSSRFLVKLRAYPNRDGANSEDALDAFSDSAHIAEIARSVLKDWRNISYKGKPLAYSEENARLLLKMRDFRQIVLGFAQRLAAEAEKRLQEDCADLCNALRWELLWGREYKTLKEVYEVTGVMPQGLKDRPQLAWYNRFYLESFYVLSNSRQLGMSAGPIPVSEVWALCQMHGDFSPEERLRFLSIMRRLDAEYLSFTEQRK